MFKKCLKFKLNSWIMMVKINGDTIRANSLIVVNIASSSHELMMMMIMMKYENAGQWIKRRIFHFLSPRWNNAVYRIRFHLIKIYLNGRLFFTRTMQLIFCCLYFTRDTISIQFTIILRRWRSQVKNAPIYAYSETNACTGSTEIGSSPYNNFIM